MEIEGDDGLKLQLNVGGIERELGRGLGLDSTDRTVSRRHVRFQLITSHEKDEPRARFQVIGKNPIWVRYCNNGEIIMYRSLQSGEMESGDMFCVSANKPICLTLKLGAENTDFGLENQWDESLQIEDLDVDSIDISAIDPVKEFGFVVMGHEFDCYPKKMIHNIKNWDWFIDEPGEEESENDDEVGGRRGKRKKRGGENDEEWMGESDEDKEVLAKTRKVKRPKYLTRSKGSERPVKTAKTGISSPQINDDETTLGGFIVDEESGGEEADSDEEEEEEEEEFDDDEEE